jgi:hypothetical protein
MKRTLSVLLAAIVPVLAAGCAYDSTTTTTAPSGLTSGNALLGLWTSDGAESSGDCHDFSWEITSQSEASMSGTFAAQCGSDTVIASNVALCQFSLSGVGTLSADTLTLPYTGQTCLGPVQGTETLHKSN